MHADTIQKNNLTHTR